MAYLPAVLGSTLKARVIERLLRRGPATIGQLAADLDASRRQVSTVVIELTILGVLKDQPTEADRRATLVSVNEEHPFIEPLRVLAVDGSAWYETPGTWQTLLARRYGQDWYLGGYAAIRRVMQPIDFEAPNVLVNHVHGPDEKPIVATLERAAGIRLRARLVDRIPPEVVPVERDGTTVWFATPERGFVEMWKLREIPTYGLFLCLVQGLQDRVLDTRKILAVAPSEGMDGEMRALLAAVGKRMPLGRLAKPARTRPRALDPVESQALDHALNTVVG